MRRRQQIHGGSVRDHFYIRVGTNPLEECPLDRKSGLIFVMDNTLQRMACLRSQVEFSGMLGRRIKRDVNFVDQNFLHEARALSTKQRRSRGRAETCASREDVRDQLLGGLSF